jgi:hypothetical protein
MRRAAAIGLLLWLVGCSGGSDSHSTLAEFRAQRQGEPDTEKEPTSSSLCV